MTDRELLQQALETLDGVARGHYDGNAADVCASIRARLAEPGDTDARVWRVMDAAQNFADADYRDVAAFHAARAELARIVREVLR